MRQQVSFYSLIAYLYFVVFNRLLSDFIPIIGYADEFLAVCAIPLFVINLRKTEWQYKVYKNGYGIYIFIFLILCGFSSLVFRYQGMVASLSDFIVCAKFWLCIYVGMVIFKNLDLLKYAERIARHIQLLALLLACMIILDYLFHIFPSTYRYGIRSQQLFMGHPTNLAACCVFLVVILVSLQDFKCKTDSAFCVLLLIMVSTLRAKAMGAALIFGYIYIKGKFRKNHLRLRDILILIPLVLFVVWEQISFYFLNPKNDDLARYQLLVKSFQVAHDHFPLGSGFATFASHFSGVYYSSLYNTYALNDVYGLASDYYRYISDSFWPLIIAQGGYIGFLCYAMGLFCLTKTLWKSLNFSTPLWESAIFSILYLLISSTSESAFMHPISIPIAMWLGFLLTNGNEHERERCRL